MADGTLDFADLLAAFDEPQPTLQQISSGHLTNLPLAGGGLSLNHQPHIAAQNHAQFPQSSQRVGGPQNRPGRISGIGQSTGLSNQAFTQPDVAQVSAGTEETFGGGSLGSLFLSSVESMLCDQDTNLVMQIQQPVAQARAVPRKPRQPRQKPNTVPSNRVANLQQSRSLQNASTQQYMNIAPAVDSVQTTGRLLDSGRSSNVLNAVSSLGIPSDMQTATANISLTGQQKMQRGSFVHPTQSTWQQPPPVNSPRPLSAASSTSEHTSFPGSIPQPSPSCGSNHSGDPATPLTPQSYNAGTPPSYKPATPQSNLAIQPRQRSTYGDIHPPQGPSAGGSENFISNQLTSMVFQPQPPSLQTMNISNDALGDLPTPVNNALDTVSTSNSSFHTQTAAVSNQHQVWNQGPAVMAPSALFTNTAQSKMPTTPNFMPSNAQMNFGYTDMYGVQIQPGQVPQRLESNVRSESLTSKQNELLEQLSSFGKNKTKLSSAVEQPNSNSSFDSGIAESGALKYLDSGKSATLIPKQPGNSETMNMMNKANNAGAAAVKELLGAHTQYEAISPVSDYGMSPARKLSLQDDFSESIIFSPPKFASTSELSLPQGMDQSHSDPMTDPVLVYLKHDGDQSNTANNISSNALSGSYFSQDVTSTASDLSASWLEQNSSSIVGSHQSNSQPSYIPNMGAEVPTLPILPATSAQSINPQYMSPWNSQIELSAEVTAIQSEVSQSLESSTAKHPTTRPGHATSPSKQKAQVASSRGTKSTSKKPFGISKRKSSSEKSKFVSLKQKKALAVDEKFGFDSDDDAEPTICLSKSSPKSSKKLSVAKPQPNLLSPKPRIANAFAGEELKNKMEHIKKLQQQQAKLRKIQEYQAQHSGGLLQPVGATMSMHRTVTNHPTSTNPTRQMAGHLKVFQETVHSYNEQQQPKYPSFPVTKESTKTVQSAQSKRPSLEFPASLSLAQPSISHKFGEMSKALVGSHDIQPTLPPMAQSSLVQTSTAPSQVPHFLSYLNLPPEPTRPVQDRRPSAASSSLLTAQQCPTSTTAPPSALLDIRSHFLQPSNTLSSQMSYSSNTSLLHTDVPFRSSQTTFHPVVSVPSSKEKDSSSASSVLLPKRTQPIDNTHINLDWLHKESEALVAEKHKTPVAIVQPWVSSSLKIPVSLSSRPDISLFTTTTVSKAMPISSIPEDHVLSLKQSIHTVHHLETPKPQPVSDAQTPMVTSKENTPVLHETKHLNLKKHRILEGAYPQSSDTYKVPHTIQSTSQSSTVSLTMAHSVLDKQRRYSKERVNMKPRHRIQHQVMDILKSQPSTTSALSKDSHMPTSTSSKTTNEEQQLPDAVAGNDDKKDDQAGSMLLLFSSLLQEASQSAKDSLKTSFNTKQGDKPSKNDDLKSVQPIPTVPKVTEVQISKAVTSTTQATKTLTGTVMTSSVMQTSSTRNVMQTSSTKTVMQTSSTKNVMQTPSSQNLPLSKKSTKKNRPAATVPFKLRSYPAFDDSQSSPAPAKAMTTPAAAVFLPSVTTSIGISTKSSLNTPSSKVATTITAQSHLPIVKPDSVLATSSATNAILTTEREAIKSSVTESVTEKLPLKSSGLPKLRITAFRSSKGEIIHQSAMLGKVTESVDSCSSNPSKRKKKKKKKRRRKMSSSDCDSTVSSCKVNPVSEQSAILVKKAIMNEQITKELEKKAEAILKFVETTTTTKETVEEEKATRKRNKAKATSENVTDTKKSAKRARVTKAGAKKKQDNKVDEPVIRYQPKSALQASSSTISGESSTTIKTSVSLPSTFHRTPGKLPLYLSSSEAKSAATVPTIQLVARNTKLIGAAENILSPPAKVVSVKIPDSLQSKAFPTHLLSNSGVQYIIPSSRMQPRVLLPNVSISTPVTAPVSIVSPLLTRSFSGGFVPVSILSTTSPSTTSAKPQLFSVPISHADSLATSIKIINTKHNDAGKSRLLHAPSVTKTPLNLSLPITKVLSKSSSILAKLTIPSVTVTRTLTTPRVATKVLSPTASVPMNANTFQSTFLKLISSQNPIPRYAPPSPPAYLEMDYDDKTQHQCLECKDSFMFCDSLDDHYQRRCILIKVRCMQCDQDLVFLNKCKLLFHARQHSDKGGNGMQFNNAHISPLPMSMCKPRTKQSFLKTNSSSVSENRRLSTTNSEEDASIAGTSVGTPATYPTLLACTDCNFRGALPEELEEHFQRVSSPGSRAKTTGSKPAANFSCDMCNVTVPNQCSFNAHMRMHKRATPHTCPECGQAFDNDGLQEQAYSESRREIDFKLHLSLHCFHLSRISAFKCKLCTSIFKNADLLRRHLEVRHLQTFYKCHDCPMAFKSQDNISSHQRSAHGVVALTKTIHKCPLCETVFTDNSTTQQLFLLQKHFEGHMNHPSINITAYKCLFCVNIYERKCLLRDHLKSVHDVTASGDSGGNDELSKGWKETRLLLGVDKNDCSSLNVAKKRSSTKFADKEPAAKISKIFSPGESAASNVLIASGIIGGFDGSRKSFYPNTSNDSPTMIKSAKQPLKLRLKGMTSRPTTGVGASMEQTSSSNMGDEMNPGGSAVAILRDGKKVYPCGECSKELPSASARLNHIRLKHKGIKTMYCCPHCPPGKIKFAKKISVKKHLKKEHGIDEITKQDVVTVHVQLPVGQKLDSVVVNLGKGNLQAPSSLHKDASDSSKHKVRKKITVLRRKPNRPIRQVRKDLENGSPYVENSDTEVEQIMDNNYSNVEDTEQSGNEVVDFSLLKLPDSYTCAKCEFQSEDRIEFQIHIMEHREDMDHEGMLSAMQQCTECGLCFASVSSHAKHLFIKHKIKRRKLLQKYDQQLKAKREASGSLPGPLSDNGMPNAQNGPVAANKHKCSVCYKRFEDDVRLRTHMRTHGLAFVKSKHAS